MGTPENSLANNQESETTTALMRSEAQRLSTFGGWQHNDKVEARKIAKAGFFHTGNDSEVKCPWCSVVLNHWEYGDQVMARHRTANPNCPFIKNISDNVPLINDAQSQVNTSQSESEDNEGNDISKLLFLIKVRSGIKNFVKFTEFVYFLIFPSNPKSMSHDSDYNSSTATLAFVRDLDLSIAYQITFR